MSLDFEFDEDGDEDCCGMMDTLYCVTITKGIEPIMVFGWFVVGYPVHA